MKWVKPDRVLVTYYDAKGETVEVRDLPTRDMGSYSVVDPGEPPAGAARQSSRAIYDHLGPATPEQQDEVKAARRTEQRKALREWAAFWGWMTLGLTLIGVGSVLGNRLGVDVTDLVSLLGGAR